MKANTQIQDPVIRKEKAIAAAGSQARLARLLEVSRAAVSDWGEFLPPYQAYRIIQVFPWLNESDRNAAAADAVRIEAFLSASSANHAPDGCSKSDFNHPCPIE